MKGSFPIFVLVIMRGSQHVGKLSKCDSYSGGESSCGAVVLKGWLSQGALRMSGSCPAGGSYHEGYPACRGLS